MADNDLSSLDNDIPDNEDFPSADLGLYKGLFTLDKIVIDTVHPHPFAVHFLWPRILADFALKVFSIISTIS